MHGQTVCKLHGGLAPQSLAAARERIARLVYPSIAGLAELIADRGHPGVRLQAIRDVLDRAGLQSAVQVQTDGKLTIEVEYVSEPIVQLPPPIALANHSASH